MYPDGEMSAQEELLRLPNSMRHSDFLCAKNIHL
jgi:hypothetical protein